MAAPSEAVLKAHAREGAQAEAEYVRFKWYADEVLSKVRLAMKERLRLAAAFVHKKCVSNISKPVVVSKTKDGVRRVVERSTYGEYPRAEFGHLRRTLGHGVTKVDNDWAGYVSTPLVYGAILELWKPLDRTFMRRTLYEERESVNKILTGPLPGF